MTEISTGQIKDEGIGDGSLSEFQEFTMGDLSFEFLPDRPEDVNLRWKCGDKSGIVVKESLWQLAFLIASDQMREKLIPVKVQEMRTFYKQVKIMAQKDIKKGQQIVANIKFTVPMEALVKATKSGMYIPN